MGVKQNSIEAYIDMMDSGELSDRQRVVYEFIRKHPNCTYNEISRVLHLHHNTVTARINELRYEYCVIICSGSKVDDITHKSNSTYRVRRRDEPCDVRETDSRPFIPKAMVEFLKKVTRTQIVSDTLEIVENGVRYTVKKTAEGNVLFSYGDFLNINGIEIVCEDNAHKDVTIQGIGYEVNFRIK